jgi:hypothetical protein
MAGSKAHTPHPVRQLDARDDQEATGIRPLDPPVEPTTFTLRAVHACRMIWLQLISLDACDAAWM